MQSRCDDREAEDIQGNQSINVLPVKAECTAPPPPSVLSLWLAFTILSFTLRLCLSSNMWTKMMWLVAGLTVLGALATEAVSSQDTRGRLVSLVRSHDTDPYSTFTNHCTHHLHLARPAPPGETC